MTPTQHITLAELQLTIRDVIADRFALPIWVSAEVADVKVNSSGHCYLELIDKGANEGTNGVPKAQARGVVWRSHYARVVGRFEAESGQQLARGIKVLVKVTLNYHELYGLSLQITDIDPSYTLGDMERRKQEAIAQLQKDGVWDMNREVEMPMLVQRIAVISSSKAAGWQDFRNELFKYGYCFVVTLHEAVMQGESAEESIVAALEEIAAQEDQYDAVVIIRGGGSTSDLNCFNSYRLASHVAQFPLPVLTGIGHDKDVSVTDMVAHTMLKTPTAVAVWLNDRMATLEAALDNAAIELHDLCTTATHRTSLQLERHTTELRMSAQRLLMSLGVKVENLAVQLRDNTRLALEKEAQRLVHLTQMAESRSPEQILKLGFAVARVAGKAITSRSQVEAGDIVTIEVADGTIKTKTIE